MVVARGNLLIEIRQANGMGCIILAVCLKAAQLRVAEATGAVAHDTAVNIPLLEIALYAASRHDREFLPLEAVRNRSNRWNTEVYR